ISSISALLCICSSRASTARFDLRFAFANLQTRYPNFLTVYAIARRNERLIWEMVPQPCATTGADDTPLLPNECLFSCWLSTKHHHTCSSRHISCGAICGDDTGDMDCDFTDPICGSNREIC